MTNKSAAVGRTRRVFNGFFPYDYHALEAFLAEMAAKGWRLEALSRFSMTFREADCRGLVPRVDLFTGAYEADHDKKLAAYRRARTREGWESAGELDFFYIWYVPEGTPVRAASNGAEAYLSQRMVWSRELGVLGIALAMLVLGLVSILKCVYTDFLTFTGLGSLLMLPLFLLPAVIVGALILRGVLPQRDAVRRGEALPDVPVPEARRRYRLLYGFLAAAAIFVLLLFVCDAVFGYTRYLTLLLPIAAAVGLTAALMRLPATLARRVLIFCAVALCGIALILLQRWSPPRPSAPADLTNVLTVERVTGGEAASSYYRATVSPAVPSHFVYTQTDADGVTAQNEYFRVPSALFRSLLLPKIRAAMGKDGLTAADPAAWGADEAWIAANGAVLLRKGSELYYYSTAGTEIAPAPGMLATPAGTGVE